MRMGKFAVDVASALLTGAVLSAGAAEQGQQRDATPDRASPLPSASPYEECRPLNPPNRADCERRMREGGDASSSQSNERPPHQPGWGEKRTQGMTEGERNREQMRSDDSHAAGPAAARENAEPTEANTENARKASSSERSTRTRSAEAKTSKPAKQKSGDDKTSTEPQPPR